MQDKTTYENLNINLKWLITLIHKYSIFNFNFSDKFTLIVSKPFTLFSSLTRHLYVFTNTIWEELQMLVVYYHQRQQNFSTPPASQFIILIFRSDILMWLPDISLQNLGSIWIEENSGNSQVSFPCLFQTGIANSLNQ